ncbi:MAG: CvpA family protein [Salinivirgaceae bacterium]|nr:CvpA family protein [Salinivirgaceae bacterium]MDD4747029.1 CvpA family protein [Salinivirgaceae bacterium]MDY0279554.1 CvpA family protein [Salinivirgaceae bacterium]
MSTLDIIIIIPLLWGAWQGFSKGLIISLASIAALLLGIWGSIKFSDLTAKILLEQFNLQSEYNSMIAFAVTFIIIVVGIHLTAFVLDKFFKAIALGIVMRIAGAAFGILKYALIISVLFAIFEVVNRNMEIASDETFEKSMLYKPVASIAPAIFSYLEFDWISQKK